MSNGLVAESSITIDAPQDRVWRVITDPEAVKEFMFGAELVTDWTEGGPIAWRGEWEGKPYEDKGTILAFDPPRRLVHTHFSPLSGAPDRPENYHTLTWTVAAGEGSGSTTLTLAQDNNPDSAAVEHAQGMWNSLVADVKKIAERG